MTIQKKAIHKNLRKFLEASQDGSGRSMRALFSEYLEAKEDWMASALVLTEGTSQEERTGGRYSWLTKAELWF